MIARMTIKPIKRKANGLKPLTFGFSVENPDIVVKF